MNAGGREFRGGGKGPDDDDDDVDLTKKSHSSSSSTDVDGLELILDEGGGYARSFTQNVSALVPSSLTSASQMPRTKLPPVHWPFRHCQKQKMFTASKIRFWDEARHFELCCPKCPIPHDGDDADRAGAPPRPLESGIRIWSTKLALFLFRLYDLQKFEDKEKRESEGQQKRVRN